MARKLITLTLLCTALTGELLDAQKCTPGDLRSVLGDDSRLYPLYCYKDEWRRLCTGSGTWTDNSARVVCRQLGYRGFVARGNGCPGEVTENTTQLMVECKSTDISIQKCGGVSDFNCTCANLAWLFCQTDCIDGEIRLVNGSTGSGRLEVCTKGLWGTVTNNDSSLAPAICSQLGHISEEAKTVPGSEFSTNFNLPLNKCTLDSEGRLNCTEVVDASQYDHFMGTGIVCHTYEQLYNENLDQCSSENILKTSPPEDASGNRIVIQILGAVIGILMAVIVAMAIGWICSCVTMRKSIIAASKKDRKGQQRTRHSELLESNLSYEGILLQSSNNHSSQSVYEGASISTHSVMAINQGTESSQTNTEVSAPEVTYEVASDPSGVAYSVVGNKVNGPRQSSDELDNLRVSTETQYAQISIASPQEGYAKLRGRLKSNPDEKYNTLVHHSNESQDFSQRSEYSTLTGGERPDQDEQYSHLPSDDKNLH